MKSLKIILKYLFIFITILSCVKLEPDQKNGSITLNSDGRVLIGNEGGFTYGNASLSLYSKNTYEFSDSVYYFLNNSSKLGDVLHSMYHIDHEIYLVMNNSGKIIVVDDETLIYKREISPLTSPRKILKVSTGKFYITDIYANNVNVYNSIDESIDQITLYGWCEELVAVNGKAFICNIDSNQINVIDIATNTLSDVIPIQGKPTCIREDNLQRLWVLSRKDNPNNNSHSISLINPQTNSIIKSFALDNNGSSPISLRINNSTNQVYFINKHLYRINGIDNSEQEVIWNNTGENFYNLEIDPYTNDIYLTDAKDYVSSGSVIILDSDGNLKNEIENCGVIPKSILF
jgi:DNA-binding beta-propeller fold protein YncE